MIKNCLGSDVVSYPETSFVGDGYILIRGRIVRPAAFPRDQSGGVPSRRWTPVVDIYRTVIHSPSRRDSRKMPYGNEVTIPDVSCYSTIGVPYITCIVRLRRVIIDVECGVG